jgi:hypothetical protein
MGAYRLYCLDDAGRIGLAEWLEASDDDDAIEQAQHLKNGARICEVWRGECLVATLGTKELGLRATVSGPGHGADPEAIYP